MTAALQGRTERAYGEQRGNEQRRADFLSLQDNVVHIVWSESRVI